MPKKGRNQIENQSVVAEFRTDLKISSGPSAPGGGPSYLVEDEITREVFTFGAEEYFLCKSLDGTSTAGEVLSRFHDQFQVEMTEEHFHNFENHLLSMGLAQRVDGKAPPEPSLPEDEEAAPGRPPKKYANPRWEVCNPAAFFKAMLRFFLPLRPLVLFLVWSLIVLVPAVVFVMFRHAEDFTVEVRSISVALGYLGGILFGLLVANFLRCFIQGIICAYYGVAPQGCGIKLRRLIFPRFYIDKSKVRTLDRRSKLWIFGTSILVRLFFIVGGGLMWALFKDSSTLIPALGVIIAQSGVIGLFLQMIPFEITDGYRWIVNFFHLPPAMFMLAWKVLVARVKGRELPDSLSGKTGTFYLIYGLIMAIGMPFGLYHVTTRMAGGFTQTFPNLFGRATFVIFCVVFATILFIWARRLVHNPAAMADPDDGDILEDFGNPKVPAEPELKPSVVKEFIRHHKWAVAVAIIALILCLPSPFRPGGEIQILPPTQQQVQSSVSGKITEVFFDGGDGVLIPKGTVIMKMTSSEMDNQILVLEQTRIQQEATLDKAKSELAKLVSGARKEEISEAEANLQQAIEEASGAAQGLASAKVASTYSSMVLPRMEKLYKSGSIAFLQYEEAKKTADIEKINVEKAQKNLASLEQSRDQAKSRLDLLRSGARTEDVDAARHSVDAAQAELARIAQQIQYARDQSAKSALLMPFDGYLVDSHLDFKVGSYLPSGQIFATAQNNSQPQVEVQFPEYDVEGAVIGAKATVKLFAYPGSPFEGKVLSVQPAALPGSEESKDVITRLFRVLIHVDKPPVALKAGMTGFAKIDAGYQPLGMLLARPIIRFVQLEMWSWLP